MLEALAIGILGSGAAETAAAPVTTGHDEATGLWYWEWNADGVVFRLTQRLPDQTRGFFLARGFDPASADNIATRCVFQSMFKNAGDAGFGQVAFDLREWRIHADSAEWPLLVRSDWEKEWAARGLSEPARIAFEWSLLPTTQEYAPGDYNWGMTSYGLPPGSRFDLAFTWRHQGELHHGRIEGIECPPDIHPTNGASSLPSAPESPP